MTNIKMYFVANWKMHGNIKDIERSKSVLKLTNSKSKIVLNKNKKRFDDFSSNYSYYNNEKIPKKWSPKYNIKSGLKEYIIEKYR